MGHPLRLGSGLAGPASLGHASSVLAMPSWSRSRSGHPLRVGIRIGDAGFVGAGVRGVGDAVAVAVGRRQGAPVAGGVLRGHAGLGRASVRGISDAVVIPVGRRQGQPFFVWSALRGPAWWGQASEASAMPSLSLSGGGAGSRCEPARGRSRPASRDTRRPRRSRHRDHCRPAPSPGPAPTRAIRGRAWWGCRRLR